MGRIAFIGTSLLVVIPMIIILCFKVVSGDKALILPLVLITGYLILDLKIIIEEFLKVKRDKERGVIREVLELYEFKILGKRQGDSMPTTPTAIFKSKTKEYIALTGDFSNVHMRKGKKYEVSYYKELREMVSIKQLFREYKRRSSYEI